MAEGQLDALAALPPATSCRLIDFEQVHIVTLDETFPPQYALVVIGTAPTFNMRVDLVPLVYIRRPEYWGIEVVGCLSGTVSLPAQRPYAVTLALAGITGTTGVEVLGANRSEQLAVPPEGDPRGAFSLSITAPGGEVLASAWLTCSPDGGTHPEPAVACRQLTVANGHIPAIPEDPGACTEEFKPVVLHASGVWDGEERTFSQEFSNLCVGVRATGGVLFDFDDRSPS